MWQAAIAMGNFVGPTVGGILVEKIGFRYTTMVLFALYVFMFSIEYIETIYIGLTHTKEKNEDHLTDDKEDIFNIICCQRFVAT